MKKRLIILSVFLMFLITVFAQNQVGVPEISKSVDLLIQGLSEFLKSVSINWDPFFNYLISISDIILKGFFTLLLFLMIYSAIDMIGLFSDKRKLNLIVTFCITALAIIFLPTEFFDFLIPSYESMFSTIFSMIPFILIIGLTIKARPLWAVRILWLFMLVFFTVSFLSLGIPSFKDGLYLQAMIYLILAFVSLFVTIFLRPIRRFFFNGEIDDLVKQMEITDDVDSAISRARKEEAKAMSDMVRNTSQ